MQTAFSRIFGLQGPLVIAPMGGGPTTPKLVAETCNAGALGSLAAAYLKPDEIDRAVEETRRLTDRPFVINLFTPMPEVRLDEDTIARARVATQRFREELGLQPPELKAPFHPDFSQQFERVLRAKPAAFSFVFGLVDRRVLEACRREGIYTIGTATTLAEALALEASGVDAVVAQGVEAGAHRGGFDPAADDAGIGVRELTRACAKRLRIPVIAAGGMMDGADIAAALADGAQAALLGTAFLLTPEAGTSGPHRNILQDPARLGTTRLTRVFSGRLARGIENRMLRELEPASILPFPAQNAFTRDIRNAAVQQRKPDFLSLWAGTGAPKIRPIPAAELVRTLFAELDAAM